jgi:hypothetical protein
MPGYSGTPLAAKLGIKEGATCVAIGAPKDYASWLAPLPKGVTWASRAGAKADVIHVFTARKADLVRRLKSLRGAMRPDAALWVSWPKKTSGVPADFTENDVRTVALPMGFVDVKVCAVSDVWSGLKLVIRKELR